MIAVVVEQLNPLATATEAKYAIRSAVPDFNEFVLSYPRGAYTGMRTVERSAVVEFDSHMKRIASSLSLLKFAPEGQEEEPDRITRQLAPFRDVASLRERLVPLLKAGLTAFKNEESDETKITVIVAYSFQTNQPCFAAHFSALWHPPQHRVKVLIETKVRTNPVVKDSRWVRERSVLEQKKGADINEVVLSDEDGNLYEGMSSNFFAVRIRDDGGPVVVCAGLEHVLLGTVMKIVMSVCGQQNIPIEWLFPRVHDIKAHKWEGCFITSTSRLLLPIETVYFADGR
ncbi:aminotransferase [Dichotomocladium elegans]|nr:aminotransferase [Dichotomocladium elegans]